MNGRAAKTLLIIEDNPGDARLIIEMLRERGLSDIELTHVQSMDEAGKHVTAHRVDLILLDLGLPDAQGLDSVRQARSAAPGVPLVVLTGMYDEKLATQALHHGAQDYLIKGQIDGRGLHRALNYAIERLSSTEAALFAERERAQVTLNSIGDAVACADVLGNVTFLNLVAEEVSGWSWQKAAGIPMTQFFHIVDAATGDDIHIPTEVARGEVRTTNLPSASILIRRDTTRVPIEGSIAPIHDHLGAATGIVIVFRDVAATRAMAQQLSDSAANLAKRNILLSRANGELAALVRSSPIAIYATDADGIVTMWSPAAERLSGFSQEEAVGEFLPIVPDDAADEIRSRVRRVSQGEPVSNVDFVGRKKDGARIELRISMGPLADDCGIARGAISLAENVTETVAERNKIERMQSEFVSTVSHELRTPLTSIAGSLGLIVGGAAGVINDRAARLIEIAQNNTRRLIRLVNDILDIERLQSGRMAFRFKAVRIGDIVSQAISANAAYAATFGVELRRCEQEAIVLIMADHDRVNQAITNLISNAVKFSPMGTAVSICGSITPVGVRISVSDQGPGIPAHFRPRMFTRFAQADSSDIRQKGGSGLGLSIVREIMERHSGRVSFESDAISGTVFHLDFPACPEQEVSSTRSRAGSAASRVVVYASDNKNAESICVMLLAHGIHCAAAVFDDDPAQEIASAFILSAIIDLSFSQKKFGALLRRLHKSPIATRFTLILISVDPAVRDHFYVAQAPHLLPWISRRAEIQWGSGAPAGALKPWLPGGRKILHVEGNRHVVAFVRQALQVEFSIVSAPTEEHAREYLAHDRFDLVILNLELSVGLVCDVLPATAKEPDQIVPLVILTAQEMSLDALSEGEMVQSAPPGNLKALVESVRSLLCIAATDS